jgi:hypothetical protein
VPRPHDGSRRRLERSDLQQVLSVEDFHRHCQSVHAIDTPQICRVVPGFPGSFVECVNSTMLAEIVLRRSRPELVKAQRPLLRINAKFLRRNGLRTHHGTLARTDGTVAAEPLCDFVRLKREPHRTAVTASSITLHIALPYPPRFRARIVTFCGRCRARSPHRKPAPALPARWPSQPPLRPSRRLRRTVFSTAAQSSPKDRRRR